MTERQLIQGRWLMPEDLALLKGWCQDHPEWSRYRLSRQLAEHWNWRTATGRLRDMAARHFLAKLQQRGLLELPARRSKGGRQAARWPAPPSRPATAICCGLDRLEPLVVELVPSRGDRARQLASTLAHYHYLGWRGPVGPHLASQQTVLTENQALRQENQHLLETLRAKNAQLLSLEEQLTAAQAQAARQAAPFRRPDKAKNRCPGKPGRRRGHRGHRRPIPAQIDHQVEVPLPHCPKCQGLVDQPQRVEQYIEELPPVRPVVTHLTTWRAYCPTCDCEVCSTHPLQVSTAVGAAGVFLGPRALALICDLNKAKGLTVRKTCAVLQDHFGLRLSPGGLTQAVSRVANKREGDYNQLVQELRAASVVHADETSWWVGGPGWWLWDFTNHQTTAYVVINNRARATVTATLGTDFAGVLVSDCLSIYDDVNPLQQKCYSHHLRAIQEAAQRHPQKASPWLDSVRLLLRTAMILAPLRASSDPVLWALVVAGLDRRAAELLGPPRAEPAEESVRNRLHKQQDHLFEFLKHDGVDPTNNLAERQLRPAVVARKLSCGNKTPKGAHAFEILASLAATAKQRGRSFVTDLTAALSKGQPSG